MFLTTGGYVLMMCHFLGFTPLFPFIFNILTSDLAFMSMFYGLYYGVLGRDLAIVASEGLAARLGFASKDGLPLKQIPANICAVCNVELYPVRLDKQVTSTEEIVELNCGHKYHNFCIRGWILIGKKDTCACCGEKVQTKSLFEDPWTNHSVAWGVVLDALRYLLVYNPIIILCAQGALAILY